MFEFEAYYNTAWEMGCITLDECNTQIDELIEILADLSEGVTRV